MASKTLVRGTGDENEDMVAVEKSIDNSIPPGAAYVTLLQTINQQGLSGTKMVYLGYTLYTPKHGKKAARVSLRT